MKKHGKRMVAPVVIAVLLVLYYIGFALFCLLSEDVSFLLQLIGGIVPLLLAGVCIFVLVERIREIRSGETDDLGKY